MNSIVVVELPKGYDQKEVDAFITGVRNIARVMFPNCSVSIESGQFIGRVIEGEVRNGDRDSVGDRARGDARVGALDGSGPAGPDGTGVPQPLQGAESRSDGRTEPPTGGSDEIGGDMTAGRRRGWMKPWRFLMKVGAGKHYAR